MTDETAAYINEVRAKTAQGRILWNVVPVTPPIHMVYFARLDLPSGPVRITLAHLHRAETSLLIEDADTGDARFEARTSDPRLDAADRDALDKLVNQVSATVASRGGHDPQGLLEELRAA